MVNADDNLKR